MFRCSKANLHKAKFVRAGDQSNLSTTILTEDRTAILRANNPDLIPETGK